MKKPKIGVWQLPLTMNSVFFFFSGGSPRDVLYVMSCTIFTTVFSNFHTATADD